MKPSIIFAIPLFVVSLAGQAASQSLESCAAMDDPVERLACYDRLAGRLPADAAKAIGTAPSPVDTAAPIPVDPVAPSAVDPAAPKPSVIEPATPAVTPTAPAVDPAPDAEAIFGLEHKQKSMEELSDKLQLKWTKKKKDAYGKWIITLENGQVWHQTDSRRFNFGNSEQWVVISRGALGSFFLGEPERSGGIRVERIK